MKTDQEYSANYFDSLQTGVVRINGIWDSPSFSRACDEFGAGLVEAYKQIAAAVIGIASEALECVKRLTQQFPVHFVEPVDGVDRLFLLRRERSMVMMRNPGGIEPEIAGLYQLVGHCFPCPGRAGRIIEINRCERPHRRIILGISLM